MASKGKSAKLTDKSGSASSEAFPSQMLHSVKYTLPFSR